MDTIQDKLDRVSSILNLGIFFDPFQERTIFAALTRLTQGKERVKGLPGLVGPNRSGTSCGGAEGATRGPSCREEGGGLPTTTQFLVP